MAYADGLYVIRLTLMSFAHFNIHAVGKVVTNSNTAFCEV